MTLLRLTLFLILIANYAVHAASAQTRDDLLRCRQMGDDVRRLACYDRLRLPEPLAATGKYQTVSLDEIRADPLSYRGALVEVSGVLTVTSSSYRLAADADDAAPLPIEAKSLSRLQRQSIAESCSQGCQALVRGSVGPVAFTTGVIADSISLAE